MIHCLPRDRVAPLEAVLGLEVAGHSVDLAIIEMAERAGASAAAGRLAEQLVAARSGCERRSVRVAALPPTGRPIVTVQGRATPFSVSLSHVGRLCGAAVCDTGNVGLDIVDAMAAGDGLDAWFTSDELALMPDDDGLLRARLWAAKEAAFKAARIDEEFRPRAAAIEHLWSSGFLWSVRGSHRLVRGAGVFVLGTHLVAVSVATGSGAIGLYGKERLS